MKTFLLIVCVVLVLEVIFAFKVVKDSQKSYSLWSIRARKSLINMNSDVMDIQTTIVTQKSPTTPNLPNVGEKFGTIQKKVNSTIVFEKVSMNSIEDGRQKPILLFLPGLDGEGVYSSNTIFSGLVKHFDCWRMIIKAEDRSSFLNIAELVIEQIASFPGGSVSVLMGESFGGLLALYVASTLTGVSKDPISIDRLVLVNPATSYDRTGWPTLGALIAKSGPAFPAMGIGALMATAVQRDQFIRIGRQIMGRINSTASARAELDNMFQAGSQIMKLLPPSTLEWRLKEWLLLGSFLMNDRFDRVTQPALILTGGGDRLLPSGQEGRRLLKTLTHKSNHSKVVDLVEFEDSGHALLDGSFDLLTVMKGSTVFKDVDFSSDDTPIAAAESVVKSKVSSIRTGSDKNQPIMDYRMGLPSAEDLAAADRQIDPLAALLSPVFFSREPQSTNGERGRVVKGLGPVPTGLEGRPVLLVGNHQLMGADLGFIVRQFIREKNTLVRGLAHPAIFQDGAMSSQEQNAQSNSVKNMFKKFGAVEVSPGSIYELMKINSTVLLFPGGVREALHGKNDKYKLFWPEKVDFVRMAGLMDAIIVPFAAIGMADSLDVLLDAEDVLKLPFVGDNARKMNSRMPQARIGVNQSFVAPIIAPSSKGPARNYFLFQQPYDTRSLNIYNKKDCMIAYEMIRGEVETGLEELLALREKDPYRYFLRRFAYERVNGKQAPSAALF